MDRLFESALERKPDNPQLKALAETLANETVAEHVEVANRIQAIYNRDLENPHAGDIRKILQSEGASSQLQALVVRFPELNSGEDVQSWKTGMALAEKRVCAISQNGSHRGTGFLIGPDRIMTNAHVVGESEALGSFQAQFGFLQGTNRDQLPKYAFAEELARSRPREYDFAIFRLNAVPEGGRGYFKVRDYAFDTIREPISLLGHPNGNPLTFSFGVIFDNNSFLGRVAYTANTAPGSSGSPLFRENWDLVGIHHHGEENVNNHGIPMKDILNDLVKKKGENLLEQS